MATCSALATERHPDSSAGTSGYRVVALMINNTQPGSAAVDISHARRRASPCLPTPFVGADLPQMEEPLYVLMQMRYIAYATTPSGVYITLTGDQYSLAQVLATGPGGNDD